MRTFWKWALVLAVPAVWAATARPADVIIPDDVTVQLLLLRQKSVQDELKLTPDAVKKIMDFTDKEAEAYAKAQASGEDERKKKEDALESDNKKFIEDNLSADQRKRLNQIALQVTGLAQLNKAEVIKALNLTDDQQKKFKDLQEKARKAFEELLDPKNREGRNEKLAKLREEERKQIDAILTDEQKAKAKEIVGEPFKGELLFEEEKP
jgi:Spy/CpxP family protein refolding chaperone